MAPTSFPPTYSAREHRRRCRIVSRSSPRSSSFKKVSFAVSFSSYSTRRVSAPSRIKFHAYARRWFYLLRCLFIGEQQNNKNSSNNKNSKIIICPRRANGWTALYCNIRQTKRTVYSSEGKVLEHLANSEVWWYSSTFSRHATPT